MTYYEALKIIHVISSTILFGTGLGTAYYFWTASLTRDPHVIAMVGQRVIIADWLFTGVSGVVQPLTGVLLIKELGFALSESWIVAAFALYAMALACWIPVVCIQIRATAVARNAVAANAPLPERFFRLMRIWFVLGWPAFAALLATFALMIVKPALW